ncbi:uncharacterized protein PAC_19229 [Phialocephala subalpina]|uniref:BZIP domain-containing protein n=1 Tax=Phialocephala subalpina TaxID=576137 RepID=A0A1L7XWG4_9HELO|nr:uncharacterized protein PAC_19229 [Phialocephala subalpina]
MDSRHAGSELQLARMPQLAEAVAKEDDWTGLTDAAARRKRQNRLNVRAFRRRKALQSQASSESTPTPSTPETQLACWIEDRQTISLIPASRTRSNSRTPLIPYLTTSPNTTFPTIIFPLSSDHLITLIQFNVLRATLTNLRLLSLLQTIPCECSLALSIEPSSPPPTSIPPTLQPTLIQSSTPHDPWIDIIPSPQWRDNLILAQGMYDQDDLCCDMAGGLWEGFPNGDANCSERGIVAWSTPWDVGGWEVSRGFWMKWGALCLRGCGDVLQATNGWRRKRGERELRWEDLGLGGEA